MQLAVLRHQAELDGLSDEELVALARQGGENAVRAAHQAQQPAAVPGRRARSCATTPRPRTSCRKPMCRHSRSSTRSAATRGSRPGSRGSLSTRRWGGCAGGDRPPNLPNWTLLPAPGGHVIMFPTSLTPPAADAELARSQVREFLEKAVDDLPDAFRLVFILRDIEEMSTEETANQLSLKPETVKTRLHRARRLMREAVEKRLCRDLFRTVSVRRSALRADGRPGHRRLQRLRAPRRAPTRRNLPRTTWPSQARRDQPVGVSRRPTQPDRPHRKAGR